WVGLAGVAAGRAQRGGPIAVLAARADLPPFASASRAASRHPVRADPDDARSAIASPVRAIECPAADLGADAETGRIALPRHAHVRHPAVLVEPAGSRAPVVVELTAVRL